MLPQKIIQNAHLLSSELLHNDLVAFFLSMWNLSFTFVIDEFIATFSKM